MPQIERPQFIPRNVYDQGVGDRLRPDELTEGELYALYANIGSITEAVLFPYRLTARQQRAGATIAHLAILDTDLQLQLNTVGRYDESDFWIPSSPLYAIGRNKSHKMVEAYTKDYFQDFYNHILNESVDLSRELELQTV